MPEPAIRATVLAVAATATCLAAALLMLDAAEDRPVTATGPSMAGATPGERPSSASAASVRTVPPAAQPTLDAQNAPVDSAAPSSVKVQVLTASGDTGARAWVELRSLAGPNTKQRTNAHGHAEFSGVPPGEVVVVVEAKRRVVFAEPGRMHLVTIQLPERVRVSGRVIDPTGKPVANASVWRVGDSISHVRTDLDGQFAWAGLRAADRLFAEKTGFARSFSVRAAAGDGSKPEIQLRRSDCQLEVAVSDSSGRPLVGVSVRVRASKAGLIKGRSGWMKPVPLQAQTDARGIAGPLEIEPGQFEITVESPPPWQPLIQSVDIVSGPNRFTLECALGAALAGTVIDSSGRPAPFASVLVDPVDRGPPVRIRAGRDGRFALSGAAVGARLNQTWTGTEDGIRIVAEHPRLGRAEAFVLVTAGQAASTELKLSSAAVVSGRLRGAPAGSTIHVTTKDEDGTSLIHPDGQFWCLPPIDWDGLELLVMVPGQALPGAVATDIAPGTSGVELEVRSAPDRVGRGRILAGGRPVHGGLVSVFASLGTAKATAKVDAQGRFRLPATHADTYLLAYQWPHAPDLAWLGRHPIQATDTDLGDIEIPASRYGRIEVVFKTAPDPDARCAIRQIGTEAVIADSAVVGPQRLAWSLPASAYEVKLSGVGRVQVTYPVRVDAGMTSQITWDGNETQQRPPIRGKLQ